jgi:hypothetical protein
VKPGHPRKNARAARVCQGVALVTLRQAARILGVSQSRAQQIEASALAKLARHPALRTFAVEAGIDVEELSQPRSQRP